MDKHYIIRNSGESETMILKCMSEEKYKFLNELFEELNHDPCSGVYCPWISIWEATPEDIEDYENRNNNFYIFK